MSPSPGTLITENIRDGTWWPDPLQTIDGVLAACCGTSLQLERTIGSQLVAGMQVGTNHEESWLSMCCFEPAAVGDTCSRSSSTPIADVMATDQEAISPTSDEINDIASACVLEVEAESQTADSALRATPVDSKDGISVAARPRAAGANGARRRGAFRRVGAAKWVGGQRRAWTHRPVRWRPKRRKRQPASCRRRGRRARREAMQAAFDSEADESSVGSGCGCAQNTAGHVGGLESGCLGSGGFRPAWGLSCCFGFVSNVSGALWRGWPSNGVRIGEASHPGPTAPTAGLEVLGGLGPGLVEALKGMITQLVQQAVQQTLSHAGLAVPQSQSPRNQRKKKAKLKKAALRKVLAGGSGALQAPSPTPPASTPGPSKGKSKGKGKSADTPAERPKGKGKGKVAGKPPEEADWTVVTRRRDQQDSFELRQQDWDPAIIRYDQLATKVEASKDASFQAVVQCLPAQVETAKTMLKASNKPHSVLLIEFAKDRKPEDRKSDTSNLRQRVPVKAGYFVRFADSFVHQVTSDGLDAAKPKGLTTAAKVIAKDATVLYVKVPQDFIAAEAWKKFGSSPRAQVAQWAALHRVQLVDAFKWTEEVLPGNRRQIFGVIKISTADAPTLLAQSGSGGVFVQAPREKSSDQYVQWIERNKDEPSGVYLARAMRSKEALGLACRGQQLGSRHHADATTKVQRIWIFEGVPRTIDMDQARTILEPLFQDLSIIRQVHKRGTKNFIFKGACCRGNEVDLLPIAIEVDDDHIVAWAKLAPPREATMQQRAIHGVSVPFVDRKSALDPVPVTVSLPAVNSSTDGSAQAPGTTPANANDATKPVSAPKRQKALQRQPPEGTKIEAQEKDGNCMYRTIACALNKGRKEPTFHHLELRARVATHIQAHPEWYEKDWKDDGSKGPDGNQCESWEAFVQAISKPGSFSGDLELRALCKLTKTKVVLIPEDANFPVVAYGKKWASTTHCVFYSSNHFDYLAPTGAAYPKELLDVVADPCGGFLVGGISELRTETASSVGRGTRAADLRTEVTGSRPSSRRGRSPKKQSRGGSCTPKSQVRAGSGRGFDVSSCGRNSAGTVQDTAELVPGPPLPPDAPPPPRRRYEPPDDLAEMLRLKLFQCRLCNYKRRGTNRRQLLDFKAYHMKRHHPGHGVMNTLSEVHTARMIRVRPGDDVAWKCPLCDLGITKEEEARMSRSVSWHLKLDHRGLKHPRIDKERWKEILRRQKRRQGPQQAVQAAQRISRLRRASVTLVSAKLPSYCVPFLWPTPTYAKPAKQGKRCTKAADRRIVRCSFKNWIKCRCCGHIFNEKPELHTGAKCPKPRAQHIIDRQTERTERLRAWLGDSRVPGLTHEQVQATFESALVAIRDPPSQNSSRF